MAPLRILIADDVELMRRGLRALLETHPEWEICGEAATGRQAVARARELRPDVVIIDVDVPELNGLQVTRQILELLPRTLVVILSMNKAAALVREALKVGASSFLLKSDAGDGLVAAVEAATQHRPYFTQYVSELMLESYLRAPPSTRRKLSGAALTRRQVEILQLVAEGKTSKEVASLLDISVRTVQSHRTDIMQQLGLRSLSELIRYAIRNHLLEL